MGTPRVGISTSEYGQDYRLGYGLGLLNRPGSRSPAPGEPDAGRHEQRGARAGQPRLVEPDEQPDHRSEHRKTNERRDKDGYGARRHRAHRHTRKQPANEESPRNSTGQCRARASFSFLRKMSQRQEIISPRATTRTSWPLRQIVRVPQSSLVMASKIARQRFSSPRCAQNQPEVTSTHMV